MGCCFSASAPPDSPEKLAAETHCAPPYACKLVTQLEVTEQDLLAAIHRPLQLLNSLRLRLQSAWMRCMPWRSSFRS